MDTQGTGMSGRVPPLASYRAFGSSSISANFSLAFCGDYVHFALQTYHIRIMIFTLLDLSLIVRNSRAGTGEDRIKEVHSPQAHAPESECLLKFVPWMPLPDLRLALPHSQSSLPLHLETIQREFQRLFQNSTYIIP